MSAPRIELLVAGDGRDTLLADDEPMQPSAGRLVPWPRWVAADWQLREGVADIAVANDVDVRELVPYLPRLRRIALQFPKWTDGRAYSQARLLRVRHRYAGELRAIGDVIPDMAAQLHRTGFDAAVLRAGESVDVARRMLALIPAFYQGGARAAPALRTRVGGPGSAMTLSVSSRVAFVGAGPGEADLITVRGAQRLQDADVVLFDSLADPALRQLAPNARWIDVGKRGFTGVAHAPRGGGRENTGQDTINALLVKHAQSGARVVRLKGGDPSVFGRLDEELEALAAAGMEHAGLLQRGHRMVAVQLIGATGARNHARRGIGGPTGMQ